MYWKKNWTYIVPNRTIPLQDQLAFLTVFILENSLQLKNLYGFLFTITPTNTCRETSIHSCPAAVLHSQEQMISYMYSTVHTYRVSLTYTSYHSLLDSLTHTLLRMEWRGSDQTAYHIPTLQRPGAEIVSMEALILIIPGWGATN